jgi:D-alanyl-D-alanine carboxypeptidase
MDNLASVFCLIALLLWKNQLLYEIVKVPPEAVYMEDKGFHIALDAGEQLTVEQRLYAIMLASAYDMALITRAAFTI